MSLVDQVSPAQARALAHPIRRTIIKLLGAQQPQSPSDISQGLDVALGTVAYHFRNLQSLGMIELTGTRPRRGATEHYYALTEAGRRLL